MKRRAAILIRITLLIGGLIAGVAAIYFWQAPVLLSYSPGAADGPVPAGNPLRLTFSQEMVLNTVEERLQIEPAQTGRLTSEGHTLVFTPDKPWPNNKVISVHLSAGAQSSGLLSLATRSEINWSFTVGYPRLAYLYPSDRAANLYLLNLQTGEIEQLTSYPGGVLDYTHNAIGTVLYYNIDFGDGGSAVYCQTLPSGETQQLLHCPAALCRYPSISIDGAYLAYERTALSGPDPANYPQVWLLPLQDGKLPETGVPPQPFLVAPANHRTQQPQWSPQGQLTYYDQTISAFVIRDLAQDETIQIPSQTGISGDWSPEGYYVIPEIYINPVNSNLIDLDTIPSSRLLRFSLDGSVLDLTGTDSVEDASPVFSPTGNQLAFARKYLEVDRWTPGRQLWLISPDGTQARQVTNDPYYNHYDFAWSPDGSQLAYVRFNKNTLTEPPELWLMDIAKSRAASSTASGAISGNTGSYTSRLVSGGYSPQWIP